MYRKEPDTFTMTTLVHGTFKIIAETVETLERESGGGSAFDKSTLVLLGQIKDTCRTASQHLSDLMWPEAPLLSPEQCKSLKLGGRKSSVSIYFRGRSVLGELKAE
jgi:hypothetical protein